MNPLINISELIQPVIVPAPSNERLQSSNMPKISIRQYASLVLDSVTSENTRRVYTKALEDFARWFELADLRHFNRAAVQSYIRHCQQQEDKSESTINQTITVLRRLAAELHANGIIDAGTEIGIKSIPALPRRGTKTGNWLEFDDAKLLVSAPDRSTLKGMRDRVLIGLLVQCGLRREEAAGLLIDQIKIRSGRKVIADLVGKGRRVRTVPVPQALAECIDEWKKAANIREGRLLRAVNKADRVEGDGMSATAIYQQVQKYARQLGLTIAPHDLRRTFGKIAYEKDGRLDQIQKTLGHSSIKTTEIYLGLTQDLSNAPCDNLGLDEEED